MTEIQETDFRDKDHERLRCPGSRLASLVSYKRQAMLWSTRDALQPSKAVSKLLDFLFILAILGSAKHEAFVSSLRNMWTASRPYCIVKRLALCSTCSARPSLNVNTGSCWKTHQGLSVAKKAFCLTFYLLSACCTLCSVQCHNLSCYFFQDFHMNEAITISPILTLRF